MSVVGPNPPAPRRAGAREGLDERQIRRIALSGALVLLASLVLVFVVENSRRVRVSFVFFSAEISLIWVIVLSTAVGMAAGVLLAGLVRRRLLGRE